MSANVPISYSISWKGILIIITIWIIFMFVFGWMFPPDGIFIGMVVFGILSFILRNTITKSHIRGMRAIRKNDFETAIEHFNQSHLFFSKHCWVDKYRSITILSYSKMCYTEIALCNLAFCYSQTGSPQKAKNLYQRILEEYPDNGIAYYSLNAIKAFSSE